MFDDILEGQKGDQGGPKLTKIQHGVKPDIFFLEGGPKKAKIFGGVKFQHFGPLLPPKSASNS